MLAVGLDVTNVTPKHQQVVKWVLKAKAMISNEVTKHAWLQHEFPFFML